jgi:hypothetical protein
MGGILAWMARIVTTGEPVPRRDRELPPAGHAEMPFYYSAHLQRTLGHPDHHRPGSPAWTFSSRGERRARWWQRRLAVELAIHRWNAQHAFRLRAGRPGGGARPRSLTRRG